ncbi:MAG: hypothetical protein ACJLTB_10450 [Algoriphagus aquaeductus]|uniref:hypothetical protein n=1 Tax=Algoriphagus aquaeductus TaxID=475299 RepID=UPI003879B108
MSNLSFGRIGKLMRLELLLHRRYYAMLVLGTFLFTFLFLLFVWYKNSEVANDFDVSIEGVSFPESTWEKSSYLGIFIGFKLLVFIVVIAQSFKELRSRSSAEFYLLLPSSVLEKVGAQFVFLITLAELILPFVFWLAIQSAYWFWTGMINGGGILSEVSKISFFELTLFFSSSGHTWAIQLLVVGISLLLFSLFFAGSLFFGKWNVILTPLSVFIYFLILAGSSIGLSQMLFSKEESVWSFQISIDQPEIFDGVPLMILASIFLLYAASALSYVVAYFKLKEREV